MIILRTQRLILRQFQLADAADLRGVLGDDEVMRFGDGAKSDRQIREWLREVTEDYYRDRGYGPWAVVLESGGELLGYCGLSYFADIDGKSEIEIGYRLTRAAWGKGYASEAAAAVRDYAFVGLRMPRLICLVAPDNLASIKVAKKIGMTFEKEVMLPGYTYPDHLYSIGG